MPKTKEKKNKNVVGDQISQESLGIALKLQHEFNKLKDAYETAKEAWEKSEKMLLARMNEGALVEQGALLIQVNTSERRNVKWKEIVLREKGKAFCDGVMNETPPTITQHVFIMPMMIAGPKS